MFPTRDSRSTVNGSLPVRSMQVWVDNDLDEERMVDRSVSRNSSAMGLGISIFARIQDSLGQQDGAVVFLGVVYRMHPAIFVWPSRVPVLASILATNECAPCRSSARVSGGALAFSPRLWPCRGR